MYDYRCTSIEKSCRTKCNTDKQSYSWVSNRGGCNGLVFKADAGANLCISSARILRPRIGKLRYLQVLIKLHIWRVRAYGDGTFPIADRPRHDRLGYAAGGNEAC